MYISSFQLNDYKSYCKSQALDLFPGINLIVGQNNVGKTALLEALGLTFQQNNYRDSKNRRKKSTQEKEPSWALVSFTLSRNELWELLLDEQQPFGIPLPIEISVPTPRILLEDEDIPDTSSSSSRRQHPYENVRKALERVMAAASFTFQVRMDAVSNNQRISLSRYPSFGLYNAGGVQSDKLNCAFCSINEEGKLVVEEVRKNSKPEFDFGLNVTRTLQGRIYSFRAERFAVESCRLEHDERLRPDASNLAEVLNNLAGKTPKKLRTLNSHLRYVFPQIHEASVRLVKGNSQHGEVIIYDEDSDDEKDAVPLKDSGTGIGQVLAMLYVLVSSKYPQVIIIDEPQSFLHPGAVRKLFEIFEMYPQHQYIVSTHQPFVITASETTSITLVTKARGRESSFTPIDTNETEHLRLCLNEVGARLADVFGADNILWVEGATERDCFPLILKKLKPQKLKGTAFVPVLSADETLGKDADRVIRIYQELSKGRGLLPPAVGFIFDRECRSDKEIADLERYANRTVKFIKRQMYENYLLNAKAIEAVLLSSTGMSKKRISASKIQKWMDQEIKRPEYYCLKIKERDPWVKYIDGAKLLGRLFAHFSDATLSYENKKVEYGVKLTKWLLENDPKDLEQIAELVQSLLPKNAEA
jgi:AAA domain, putative AbiEii toxin, Type IV TA system/AAA ATPase domain